MAGGQVHWREVVPRVVAASIGAYAICSLWAAALIRLLPMEGVDATITATSLAFLLFVFLILRAFAARALRRLGGEMLVAIAVPALLLMVLPR